MIDGSDVLQRKASTQQLGILLVPAIKGLYINTHFNYSQPVLTKLYNENIGGHRYTFTPDTNPNRPTGGELSENWH